MKPPSMKSILTGKSTAKQPASKPKKANKKTTAEMPMVASGEPKTVRITQAQNGFTVGHYGREGEVMRIAKDLPEAMKHVEGMMK